MITVHQEYLVDKEGRRKAVILPIAEWEQILEALEELEDIRAYDEAKQYPSAPVPFDQAVAEIREGEVP
jgi:PHD/YefM family antitoxin component YafN of YafNO toxin-antitoxin module